MPEDVGSLLLRAGLVTADQIESARKAAYDLGGTVPEQLVRLGLLGDEELTMFYRRRLLIPRVAPSQLTRLSPALLERLPADMAAEFRAIPISIDADNNLTLVMSDPSDTRAVDEIGFFTGAFVVRAITTQAQIAWCLSRYYQTQTELYLSLIKSGQWPESPQDILANRVPAHAFDASEAETGPIAISTLTKEPRTPNPEDQVVCSGVIQTTPPPDHDIESQPAVVVDMGAVALVDDREKPRRKTTLGIPRGAMVRTDNSRSITVPRWPVALPQPIASATEQSEPLANELDKGAIPTAIETDVEITQVNQAQESKTRDPKSPIPHIITDEQNATVKSDEPESVRVLGMQNAATKALHALRRIDRAQTRGAIVQPMLGFLQLAYRKTGFLALREGTLVPWLDPDAVSSFADATITIDIEADSTFRDVVRMRLPYRGPIDDSVTRRLADAVGCHTARDILALPLLVRNKVVGVVFGVSSCGPLFQEHLTMLMGAASEALEQHVLAAKRKKLRHN